MKYLALLAVTSVQGLDYAPPTNPGADWTANCVDLGNNHYISAKPQVENGNIVFAVWQQENSWTAIGFTNVMSEGETPEVIMRGDFALAQSRGGDANQQDVKDFNGNEDKKPAREDNN